MQNFKIKPNSACFFTNIGQYFNGHYALLVTRFLASGPTGMFFVVVKYDLLVDPHHIR